MLAPILNFKNHTRLKSFENAPSHLWVQLLVKTPPGLFPNFRRASSTVPWFIHPTNPLFFFGVSGSLYRWSVGVSLKLTGTTCSWSHITIDSHRHPGQKAFTLQNCARNCMSWCLSYLGKGTQFSCQKFDTSQVVFHPFACRIKSAILPFWNLQRKNNYHIPSPQVHKPSK